MCKKESITFVSQQDSVGSYNGSKVGHISGIFFAVKQKSRQFKSITINSNSKGKLKVLKIFLSSKRSKKRNLFLYLLGFLSPGIGMEQRVQPGWVQTFNQISGAR